jgi:hypothetical protein
VDGRGAHLAGQAPVGAAPGAAAAAGEEGHDDPIAGCDIRHPIAQLLDDARGFVINDYQNYLEEKWIAELRKKYPVTVNEAVFKTLLQQ